MKKKLSPKLYKVIVDGHVSLVRSLTRLGAKRAIKQDIIASVATQDDLVQYLPQVEIIDVTKQSDL